MEQLICDGFSPSALGHHSQLKVQMLYVQCLHGKAPPAQIVAVPKVDFSGNKV